MRQPGQTASIVRKSLFESEPIRIASFAADPVSEACGDVERQDTHVMVLPFASVFAKHEAPGRHVVGTPSHAVLIAADSPYRLAFPGAIVDRAISMTACGGERCLRQVPREVPSQMHLQMSCNKGNLRPS